MHHTSNASRQQALARTSRTSQACTPARCQRFGHLLVPGLATGEQCCARCHARLLCPVCVPDRPASVILARCEQHRDHPVPPSSTLLSRVPQKGGSSHGTL